MKQFILIACIVLASCTDNKNAKDYGGTAKITLKENEKLINVTWKDTDLWYLTRPMIESDTAAVYVFHEKSSLGVWEGTYIITEVKTMPENLLIHSDMIINGKKVDYQSFGSDSVSIKINGKNNVVQYRSGKGDNVAGDKNVINNVQNLNQ